MISEIITCIGLFFVFTGIVGIFRFHDFDTRLHAFGVIDSLGVPITLLGLLTFIPLSLNSIKIIILILLFMIMSATSTHIISHARRTCSTEYNDDN